MWKQNSNQLPNIIELEKNSHFVEDKKKKFL